RTTVPLWNGIVPWSAWNLVARWTNSVLVASGVSSATAGQGRMAPAYLGAVSDPRLVLSGLLCLVLVAGVLTGIWSLLDRRRSDHVGLYEGTRVYARFALAVVLINYGIFKIVLNQGEIATAPSTLLTPVGMIPTQSAPFLILASPFYQI